MSANNTLRNWIIQAAGGEEIEGVVIGEHEGYNEEVDALQEGKRGRVLSFEEADPLLSYTFANGFGGAECNKITAWTKSWVIFVSEYDGATNWNRMPRHPIDHQPTWG